ncbi:MAG: C25 family cysteine peptidase [Candidatus Aminicenantes bacterium]|nr:C25 family cysteine peptidase [Candidatus Aminicenantes bacterium]
MINNNWANFHTVASPAAGHWRLDVSSLAGGDDMNGYGIRAHDGTSGSGGTELNMYGYSYVSCGWVGTGSSTSTRYPYITSGCSFSWNNWDGDSLSTHNLRSRTGRVSGPTFNGSGNNAWGRQTINNYDLPLINSDTGIWTWTGIYTDTGGGAGNYGILYTGNYADPAPPPTSQPQTTTFRIYFPTDAGGVPSKPSVTQKLSFVSGPNPPTYTPSPGTTLPTYVRVEIVVYNPAAQAITFSSGNLVTANIPGNGVVYAGNATASQGQASISAPSIDGTGNITWNPGTVAAGETATLYYQVKVTPISDDQVLPVTGIPTLNGTTAKYVDETGDTTAGRPATYTYGPLCGLSVTEGGTPIPTWVAISCFEANMTSGQPMVEWHTGAENGTVGFNLWRQDGESGSYQLVNTDLLPALNNAMTGGIYRLVDPDVRYGETVVYRIEEVDAWGNTHEYGPFTVTFEDMPPKFNKTGNFYLKNSQEVSTAINGFRSEVFTASEYEKSRLLARRDAVRDQGAEPMAQSSGQARIEVKKRGLFRLDAASISAALGMSTAQVESLIASYQLSLSNQGEPVAWLADENRSGIYFYNEPLQSAYSEQNIYWLEQGNGLALVTVDGGTAAAADAGQTFNDTSHFEENHYPLPSLFSKPDDDFWLWDLIVAGSPSTSFTIQVPGPADDGTATLTVNLLGATDTAASIDHRVRVLLNGRKIGESVWDGINPHTCQFNFYQTLLSDGKNTINVEGIKLNGVPYSYFYVDSYDLNYRRFYQAKNNVLWCQGDGNQTISATGFSDTRVMVWDVSQSRQPKLVRTAGLDVGGRVTFNPADPANKYLVIGLSAVLQPISVTAASTTNLQNADDVEYFILAPSEFAEAARPLAEYRLSQGLSAAVVTLEDIYNNFNSGLASPLAVKDFLHSVYRRRRSLASLKYVVLIGKGTFDYNNYLGHDDNLFPIILANTAEGLFAADNLYGDLKGDDGIPEIAVGRLPVVSVDELRTVINKIKAYGSSQGAWTDKALMISDNADSGGDFLASSETLVSEISGYTVERLSLLGYNNSADIRQGIIDGINRGAALVNYVGHAGMDQLAQESILSISDLPLLQNGYNLPIMILVTCVVGRFDIPGNVCLGEALLLKSNGGVVTEVAPTSASYNANANLLIDELYKAVFKAQEKDLGMAWLRAAQNFTLQGGNPNILNIYNILGDPAVSFK